MDKKLKILIIGFGSIGKRHYQNLTALGFGEVFVYDENESSFKDYPKIAKMENLSSETVKVFKAVFICTPTSLHLQHATLAAKAGCHLFIEKPVSHSLDGFAELENVCKEKKLITLIGSNMRFHPALAFIKNYIESGKLGKIFGITHEFGYYLPYWREGQDYRKNYAAKKALGGGIILDDIHEFDLLFWLNDFSEVLKHKIISGRSGSLEIETEDQAVGTFLFKNGVLGTVRCDYLSKKYRRNCLVLGEAGSLYWDFNDNDVWLLTKDKAEKLFSIKNYDTNQMYKDELQYFFDRVEKGEETFNDLSRAKLVLSYCLNYD
ncbi:MAG TPA: Gfo/Idh/MocA family oxidoreductase [Candidatus Paceibacterota bacterium]